MDKQRLPWNEEADRIMLTGVQWKVWFSDDPTDFIFTTATTGSVARDRASVSTGRIPVRAELEKE